MLNLQQFIVGLIILTHWLACTFKMLHDVQWDERGCDGSEATPCTWLIKYESSSYNVRNGLENAPTAGASTRSGQPDFISRSGQNFWLDRSGGGGRAGSASQSKLYGQNDP